MLVFLREDDTFGRKTALGIYEALLKIRQNIESDAAYCTPHRSFDMVRHPTLTSHRMLETRASLTRSP